MDDTVYTYEVLDPKLTITFNVVPFDKDCFLDYQKTVTALRFDPEPDPGASSDFISSDRHKLDVESIEPLDAGEYSIIVDITFTGYPKIYEPSGQITL